MSVLNHYEVSSVFFFEYANLEYGFLSVDIQGNDGICD